MSDMQLTSSLTGGAFGDELLPSNRGHVDAEFDITAMIDLVFMMNIYFLVTFITAALGEIDLASANHCAPLDGDTAITISILPGSSAQDVIVYIGEIKKAEGLRDPSEQQQHVSQAVERAQAEGKVAVLIKAEKNIRLRETKRLALAAVRDGMTLHLGVMEKDTSP
jgi:biopolymer transport protein ExbD